MAKIKCTTLENLRALKKDLRFTGEALKQHNYTDFVINESLGALIHILIREFENRDKYVDESADNDLKTLETYIKLHELKRVGLLNPDTNLINLTRETLGLNKIDVSDQKQEEMDTDTKEVSTEDQPKYKVGDELFTKSPDENGYVIKGNIVGMDKSRHYGRYAVHYGSILQKEDIHYHSEEDLDFAWQKIGSEYQPKTYTAEDLKQAKLEVLEQVENLIFIASQKRPIQTINDVINQLRQEILNQNDND